MEVPGTGGTVHAEQGETVHAGRVAQPYFSQSWLISFDRIECSAAIGNCGKQKLWQLALTALACMQDTVLLPDVVICTACLTACSKGQQAERALFLFDDMANLKLTPTAVTYGAAVQACAGSSRWQRALELLGASRPPGSANSFVSTAAISSCGKAGQWRLALRVLQDGGF